MKRSLRAPKPKGVKARVGAIGVRRFSVEFTVSNIEDEILVRRGRLAPEQARRITLSGVVDSGASHLVLPRAVVQQLGLQPNGTMSVRYANGLVAEREKVMGAFVELMGRSNEFGALVEPRRRDALIGSIVLEALDFLIDPLNERIIPGHARGPLFEI